MSNWLSSAQVDRIRRLLRSGREDFGTPSTCGLQIINGAAPTAGIECSGAKSAAQLGVSRRRFLASVLSAGAVAATVDLEQLIWTPSSQILIPGPSQNLGELVAIAWEKSIGAVPEDTTFSDFWLLNQLRDPFKVKGIVNYEYNLTVESE